MALKKKEKTLLAIILFILGSFILSQNPINWQSPSFVSIVGALFFVAGVYIAAIQYLE